MSLISILIPCYNEEASLPALYQALCTVCNPLQSAAAVAMPSGAMHCEGLTPPPRNRLFV